MPHVSIRVSEQEKKEMENYAKFMGRTLSDALKTVFFERLEDELDLKLIREFEEEEAKGDMKYYTHEEVKKILGL